MCGQHGGSDFHGKPPSICHLLHIEIRSRKFSKILAEFVEEPARVGDIVPGEEPRWAAFNGMDEESVVSHQRGARPPGIAAAVGEPIAHRRPAPVGMCLEELLGPGGMGFAVVFEKGDDGSRGFFCGLGAGDAPEVQAGPAEVFRGETGRHDQRGNRILRAIKDHDLQQIVRTTLAAQGVENALGVCTICADDHHNRNGRADGQDHGEDLSKTALQINAGGRAFNLLDQGS